MHPFCIIGAGISGLAAGQRLHHAGSNPIVLERSRGVGGRCATRQFSGQPVDYGPTFLHGRDARFLALLEAVPATRLTWPQNIRGNGVPCQPGAFDPAETRLAYAEGLAALPRHLARHLDIRFSSRVTAVHAADKAWTVHLASGDSFSCATLVLGLALEQTRHLLTPLRHRPELRSIAHLLDTFASDPCLTVLASYDKGVPPDWDVCYPEDSAVLQLIAHDSRKRSSGGPFMLVYQSRAAWARSQGDATKWSKVMLQHAGDMLGSWAAQPLAIHPHRWSYSRLHSGCALAGPVLLELSGGARLGLVGDVFHPNGGIEGAFLAGDLLGQRLEQGG